MKFLEVAGVKISVVGLGTWQFGSSEWGYGSSYAQEIAPALVNRALDLGINLIDTAEAYAMGKSEKIIGHALEGRREEAFLATKLFPLLPIDPIVSSRARGSARRLKTDVIDLYQLHWPNPVVPIAPTMKALGQLVDAGLIRHLGVSNYSLEQWKAADEALGRPILANQVCFNLIDRGPADELVDWAAANDRVIIAYSPLAQGLLSGRYDAQNQAKGMRAGTPNFLAENVVRVTPIIDCVREVAAAHEVTCSQVALAWLIAQPNTVVIPGASSIDQLNANAAAADVELSGDELARLDEVSRSNQPQRGNAVIVPLIKARLTPVAERIRGIVKGLSN